MSDEKLCLALFKDLDPAANAIEKLHEFGVSDSDISVMSGVPILEKALGRPERPSLVPFFAGLGTLGGLGIGMFLSWGTPWLYPIVVGGQPLFSIPPQVILTFETTMLGLLILTFLGVIWESAFPAFGARQYSAKVSDGQIGVVFNCPERQRDQIQQSLLQLGAISVEQAEAMKI